MQTCRSLSSSLQMLAVHNQSCSGWSQWELDDHYTISDEWNDVAGDGALICSFDDCDDT